MPDSQLGALPNIDSTTFYVGGLELHVHTRSKKKGTPASTKPAAMMFVLHGRHGSVRNRATLAILNGLLDGDDDYPNELFCITFDQRNHGHRTMNKKSNEGWSKEPEKHNPTHAIDMYAIQTGTANDVSFVIDHLPAFLFPLGEREIVSWGITGVSLGGHSTWIALTKEPRLSLAAPIIGCPHYLGLILPRAAKHNIPTDNTREFPNNLRALIQRTDPSTFPYTLKDAKNPFLGRKILVLSGAADPVVPWAASKEFVEQLEVGDSGLKEVFVEEGAKHETTPEMVKRLSAFVKKHFLSA
ncbi:alpha/beta-hydrolase [Cylindrobasidium torrendii FP15055 ss-10]|uniref:Alpha/beta-hydrolase n=1 Tax=Cylindrobasidium torrendii FP15055 ss-10 TaxID=1314674 RepID=A0A0D7AZ84_9AGAR|nr:alpha/beta-hydrolase [Cylindrobasidium torrendii FP15055 ss-10]